MNDGAAVVMVVFVASWIAGEPTTVGAIGTALAASIGGGGAVRPGGGGGLLIVVGRAEDYLVEVTLTLLAACGSFLFAERFGVWGVLATLTAGVFIGNFGHARRFSDLGNEAMLRFRNYAAFLANSIVFLLIGTREATPAAAR